MISQTYKKNREKYYYVLMNDDERTCFTKAEQYFK